MASRGHKPAGGAKEKNVVRKPVRTGAAKERIRQAGVAQIGAAQGNHVTEQGSTGYGGISPFGAGKGYPSELGNRVALNVGKGGPGAGRQIIGKSGQQGCHGEVNRGEPMPRTKEIWPGFGK